MVGTKLFAKPDMLYFYTGRHIGISIAASTWPHYVLITIYLALVHYATVAIGRKNWDFISITETVEFR